jgi:ornithine cyclodeaminase/alanine dehydrogenase-like protein (mu-crystallin family)
MLIPSSAETASLLEPDALRQALASAMAELSAGRVSMPPRIAADVEETGGFVAAMPAYLPATGMVAAKLVSLYPAAGPAAACADADVVCLTTGAAEPVVRRADLAPGTHVNPVGFKSGGREVDSATVADALVVVESRASVLASTPAGSSDLRVPMEEGVLDPGDLVEVGEIVAGTATGRTSAEQLTLYKSVGVAVQDAAAAAVSAPQRPPTAMSPVARPHHR